MIHDSFNTDDSIINILVPYIYVFTIRMLIKQIILILRVTINFNKRQFISSINLRYKLRYKLRNG